MNILKSFVSGLLAPVRFLTSLLARLVSVPRRFLGLSLPARITLVIATVLLVTLLIAMVWQIRAEGMDLQSRKLLWYTSLVLGLVALISTIVYWAVRLWLEGGMPRYPDIDDAWKAGVAALAKNRLSFQDLPVFLIIGSPDTETARHILRAANLQGPLDGVPEGRSPLLWYASDRAIYLVTSELGCLGHLHHSARDGQRGGSAAARPEVAEGSQARLRGTLVPGARAGEVREAAREKNAAPSSEFPADIRGTIKPVRQCAVRGTTRRCGQHTSRSRTPFGRGSGTDRPSDTCLSAPAAPTEPCLPDQWHLDRSAVRGAGRHHGRQGRAARWSVRIWTQSGIRPASIA